jgi:meso-butanediol dehydrogenase / (S,S)-butanediol dehydrogenase / diacetyl reductase
MQSTLNTVNTSGDTRNDATESATSSGGAMRFQEKVVIITGSSAGIGAATARRLASEGALLVVNGRSADKLERFASELPQDRVLLHIGDVSEEANAKALIASAIDRFGQIDVLVNNASFFGFADLASQTVNDWRQTFATNLDAVFHISQAALPHLAEGASIVNVSSVSALGGDMMMSAYNAAKGALTNYTRALAVELGSRGIRVNAVLPSIAWTDRTAILRDNSAIVARQIERMPLGRIAEAEEVAAAIAFLASQDASYITGVNLPVDGGLTASSGLAPFV